MNIELSRFVSNEEFNLFVALMRETNGRFVGNPIHYVNETYMVIGWDRNEDYELFNNRLRNLTIPIVEKVRPKPWWRRLNWFIT